MTKRPYQQTRRAEAVEGTRLRILDSARDQLVSGDPFTIDAIAKRAGVTRATVYAQFATRDDLREAVFDQLAESGGLTQIPRAFMEPDPLNGLRVLVEIFCSFYATHRTVLRRLNALAALATTGPARPRGRNERRHEALTVLIGRIVESDAGHKKCDVASAASTIQALTSFEFFDEIAATGEEASEYAAVIFALVRSAIA